MPTFAGGSMRACLPTQLNNHHMSKRKPDEAAAVQPPAKQAALTSEEAKQYDRQIRLWGWEAQHRYSPASPF